MATKRGLPPKVLKMRKKQKHGAWPPPAPQAQGAPSKFSVGDVVDIDSLPWKADDTYDLLEEIDDVDVVKDETASSISFRIAGKRALPPAKSPGADRVNVNGPKELGDQRPAAPGQIDEEWEGFGSDDDASQIDEKLLNGSLRDNKPSKKTDRKAESAQTKNGLSYGSFLALDDRGEEDSVDLPEWQSLNLAPQTVAALSKQKFVRPTEIQRAAIPHIMAGDDLVGKAQTGSGKTLAFGIPILERWLATHAQSIDDAKIPTALVILPTRELAHQIEKHLQAMCSHEAYAGMMIATLTGGLSLHKQKRLATKADIIIATPGRLWEFIEGTEGFLPLLQKVAFLVLDEADRLLSQGHFKELDQILTALDRQVTDTEPVRPIVSKSTKRNAAVDRPPPSHRQTLVFSATFSRTLQQSLSRQSRMKYDSSTPESSMQYLISKLNFRSEEPIYVDVNPTVPLAAKLREGILECPTGLEKDLYLYTLLLYHTNVRTLVFVNSISAVRRLVPFLQSLNLPSLPLHSQMPQKARLRSIERFSGAAAATKPNSILVATDVAARGLDIPLVRLVVHYHLPRAADTYVHRSGRTARAENAGSSVLICAPEEAQGMRRLVAQVHTARKNRSNDDDPAGGSNAGNKRGAAGAAAAGGMQSLDLDKKLVGRLRERAKLAKRIADAELAKEKKRGEHDFMAEAARDLGVELDSEGEIGGEGRGGEAEKGRGRGRQRKEREREGRGLTKAELAGMKAELKEMLRQRVNTGVSERYLTSGGLDIDELLRQRESGGLFLGKLPELGFEV